MENNKNTKIALTIVIMLIVTITSVIAAAVMYGMLMESKKDDRENVNINSNLNDEIYEETGEELKNTKQENNDAEIDLDTAMIVTERYLDLMGRREGSYRGFLEELKLVDKVEMDETETITNSDSIKLWKTNIKYEDFRNKLLTYVSEKCFKAKINVHNQFAEKDGYLYSMTGGASGASYDVYEANLKEENSDGYVYIAKATMLGAADIPEYITVEATIIKENGRFVLDNLEYINN